MPNPDETSYVELNPDSTGKRVRTFIDTETNFDGTSTDTHTQGVIATDLYGNRITLIPNALNEMLIELRAIRLGLENLTGEPLHDIASED